MESVHGMSSLVHHEIIDDEAIAGAAAATAAAAKEPRKAGILDVLEPLSASGFLREATRLCLTSKVMAAAAPMGTGRQVYEAAKTGDDGNLTVYLQYWSTSRDSKRVLNWAPNGHDSPLMAAAQFNRLGCLELLLSLTSKVEVNVGDRTALHWACLHGRAAMVRALLAAPGIRVNKSTKRGRAPLHEAAEEGHAEVARLLVAIKGVDLEVKNDEEMTPLELAEKGGHGEVAAILAEAMEKKAAQDAGSERVHHAASDGNLMTLTSLVEEWSGHEDVLNWECMGMKPLTIAARNGHTEVVRLLAFTPGVNVNVTDRDGWNPLMVATFNGYVDIVRVLLTVEGIDLTRRAASYLFMPFTFTDFSALGIATTRFRSFVHVDDDALWVRKQEIAVLLRAAGARDKSEEQEVEQASPGYSAVDSEMSRLLSLIRL